jgi:hypothetical protein
MNRPVTKSFFLLSFTAISAFAQARQTNPKPLDPEKLRVVATVEAMFRALEGSDLRALDCVTEPGFYVFDSGTRLDAESILALLQQVELSGKHFEWHVTDPDVHIDRSTAWVAYVDRGSITDATGRTDKTWLESAFLVKRAGGWRLAFMQSTPAAEISGTK